MTPLVAASKALSFEITSTISKQSFLQKKIDLFL